jgi:hypothetical protein
LCWCQHYVCVLLRFHKWSRRRSFICKSQPNSMRYYGINIEFGSLQLIISTCKHHEQWTIMEQMQYHQVLHISQFQNIL